MSEISLMKDESDFGANLRQSDHPQITIFEENEIIKYKDLNNNEGNTGNVDSNVGNQDEVKTPAWDLIKSADYTVVRDTQPNGVTLDAKKSFKIDEFNFNDIYKNIVTDSSIIPFHHFQSPLGQVMMSLYNSSKRPFK